VGGLSRYIYFLISQKPQLIISHIFPRSMDVFTGLTEYQHLARRMPFERILQARRDVAVEKDLP